MPGLLDCPIEIKRQILGSLVLVPRLPAGYAQGLEIHAGKAGKHLQDITTSAHSLFLVNREISILTQEILWGENRIILSGEIEQTVKWVDLQPMHIFKRFRRLDLVISTRQFYSSALLAGWDTLIQHLGDKLDPKNLMLSIDGNLYYTDITEGHGDFEFLKPVYQIITASFTNTRSFSNLKDFWVHWPVYNSMEAVSEQQVKGNGYDSIAQGKTPYSERNPQYIHGWEWEELDEDDEPLEEWEDFLKGGMIDPGEA